MAFVADLKWRQQPQQHDEDYFAYISSIEII